MKKWTIFTFIIVLLFWAMPSLAWYPEQEKDGIKDNKSPEEVKKLIDEGMYGMRVDYEPKPGFPWKQELEKGGPTTAEQLMWLGDMRNSGMSFEGFYSRNTWRHSLKMNARGHKRMSQTINYYYLLFNEGQPKGEDNYADILSYHDGKFKEGNMVMQDVLLWYGPPLEVGNNLLEYHYIKTPRKYKEVDRWRYFAGRRKVIRLGAGDKAELIGGGVATYDDIGGRQPWEQDCKVIGTDVLRPEDRWFGNHQLDSEPIKHPEECWVVEAKFRDPGYYLGKRVMWFSKSKDPRRIHKIRDEHYDREGNLWKVWEALYTEEPQEDGFQALIRDEVWDLQIDFRDQVGFDDGNWKAIHGYPVPGGDRTKFFSLERSYKEQFWDKLPDQHKKVFDSRWARWSKLPGPKLLRERFPEHRKIILRSEVEEKIRKLVEKGVLE